MPTKPIGTGTRNFPVNAPVDWFAELGKAACASGVSMGQYIRELTEAGAAVRNPALARQLRSIRTQYYGAILAGLCLAITWQAMWTKDDEAMRRGGRRVQVVRRVVKSRGEDVA